MYNGYLMIGANEVANNPRAVGYQQTSDCPIMWVIADDEDDHLPGALFDIPYTYSSIEQAPWFDPDDPDTTSRFLGGYVLSIEGLPDSTIDVQSSEKLTDGGVETGSRHASREVRVRMFLTARGMDALETGMTWLRNALAARACGVHGAACNAADLQFFVSCPPPRGYDSVYTEWAITERNVFPNPSFETAGSIPAGAELSTEWSVSGTHSLYVPYPEGSGYGHGPYGHTPYGH